VQQKRDLGSVAPQRPAQIDAGPVGQFVVDDGQVRAVRGHRVMPVPLRSRGRQNLDAGVRQQRGEQFGQQGMIFDENHGHGSSGSLLVGPAFVHVLSMPSPHRKPT
jgi:hypothetical protein